jgi:predicted nucleic acid-binding protein
MDEILIDTNVLVYAHQPAEREKYRTAVRIVAALVDAGRGRLSAQVLGEFINATTRGARPLLSVPDALAQAGRLAEALVVLDVNRLVVLEAIRGVRVHRLSYYDAQIWAAARLNQVTTVLSEDFAADSRLEGVQFVNPFVRDFDFERWA